MPLPKVIDAEEFEETLDVWVDELESMNWESALGKCIPTLTTDFENHFMQSQGDDGPWAPRKDNKPHPLLILTGALLEAARDTGNAGNIHYIDEDTIVLGVNGSVVEYAAFHQYGTSKMVARPFIWASDEAIDSCVEIFASEAFGLIVK